MSTIQQAFKDGGGWMIPILIVSFIALAVVIERFIFLVTRYNMDAKAFMADIQKLVMAGSLDRAIKLCGVKSAAALPRVVKAGLTRANKGETAIANAIEEATLEVIPMVTRRTNSLLALANIATLLGLLGTIAGLIDVFATLESAAPEDRQRLLARGIALAMNTTAFGLVVAIPTMTFHLFLSGVQKKIVEEIEQYSVRLQNLLVAHSKGKAVAE